MGFGTMKVWITTVGTSVFAVVNPVWAACILDGFVPERVHLLKNEKIEGNVQTVKNWLTSILECFGVRPEFHEHDADEDNMDSFARTLISVVKSEVGNEVAVDMTPGRKFMSACAMAAGQKFRVSKLYYLHLYNLAYQEKPLILIPFNQQKLINVLNYTGGVPE